MTTRKHWCDIAYKLSFPVLDAFAKHQFKSVFIDDKPTASLEALARVLVGIAPWLELDTDEQAQHLGELARKSLQTITNTKSPDYIDFSIHEQVLVDSALLCQAFVRAPQQLWVKLPRDVQCDIIKCIQTTRQYPPHDNNWVFPSMIEAFFMSIQEHVDYKRLMEGIMHYKTWYVGDGVYGDGEEFHFDYYNSYIIQPMLYDILNIVHKVDKTLNEFFLIHVNRLQRWATIQERMISPNGTFPSIGRSLTYRSAAFHGLALCALLNNLHKSLQPAQVRVALSRVIKATLEHPNTFEEGWLTKGLYGKQPSLSEPYINHGSLYISSTVFLPLGLPSNASFWADKDVPITWEILEKGCDFSRDKPHTECVRKKGKCV